MSSLLDSVYQAVAAGELDEFARQLREDVFVCTPEADGVLLSREEVTGAAAEWFSSIRALPGGIRLEAETLASGQSPDGNAAWLFDVVSIRVGEHEDVLPIRVRVTAVLTRTTGAWRVASCYWSLPFGTQAEQDAVKHAGRLDAGMLLPEGVDPPARPLETALVQALEEPRRLPDLYSVSPGHATIGSVVDEVFLGDAGRAAWREFVQYVSSFTLRGPVRAAQVNQDVAWLAANIDIGEPPTPYRFFYVWGREDGDWRIVISHDAVARSLDARTFQ